MLTKLDTVKVRDMVRIGLKIALFMGVVTLALVAALGLVRPALAEELPPYQEFDAGTACSFRLGLDISDGHRIDDKVFTDKDGNVVRILFAGKGFLETFTNLETGATVTYKTGGSVTHITINPDGTLTLVFTGHNVIMLAPTDVPPGPSTILYRGTLVATISTTGVGTVEKVSGTQIDICAALSQ